MSATPEDSLAKVISISDDLASLVERWMHYLVIEENSGARMDFLDCEDALIRYRDLKKEIT